MVYKSRGLKTAYSRIKNATLQLWLCFKTTVLVGKLSVGPESGYACQGNFKDNGTNMATLLERIAAGDQQAIAKCIDAYGGLTWSVCQRLLPNDAYTEEIVQEVFIQVWEKAGSYDISKGAESTFITTIARRRCIDFLRKLQRTPDGYFSDKDEVEQLVTLQALPDTMTEISVVLEAMNALPNPQDEVVRLNTCYGYSHTEIANELQLPVGTVKTLIRRGLAELRDQLETVTKDKASPRTGEGEPKPVCMPFYGATKSSSRIKPNGKPPPAASRATAV